MSQIASSVGRPRLLCTALLALTLAGSDVSADDWPQFRGPLRDGASAETGLLKAWPENGPEELWRTAIGPGFAGVAVVGDRLYTMDSSKEKEFAVALDSTGQEIWRAEVGALFTEAGTGPGPRSMPTVAGDMLWALGSYGDLVALNRLDGTSAWTVNVQEHFGSELAVFGFAMVPLVVGDLLILETGASGESSVVAFDKKTGEIVWQRATAPLAYSSPIYLKWHGVEQIVFLNQTNLLALSPKGHVLWKEPFAHTFPMKVALPLFVAPDLLFVSASYDIGAMTVRLKPELDENGSVTGVTSEKLWESRVMRNHFNTSVAHDGLIYGFDNSSLKCIDAGTGEQKWAKRGRLGKGSLIYADGNLVVLSERGHLLLVGANGQSYEEKGSAQVFEDGPTWVPPTLAHGRLYLRSPNELLCLNLKADV